MKTTLPNKNRLTQTVYGVGDEQNGVFRVGELHILASNGGGWDHVSVSLSDRCPTWEEMCTVKDLFFDAEECVLQYHPPKSMYVNCHPYCLHLWKPQNSMFPLPPIEFVGPISTGNPKGSDEEGEI